MDVENEWAGSCVDVENEWAGSICKLQTLVHPRYEATPFSRMQV